MRETLIAQFAAGSKPDGRVKDLVFYSGAAVERMNFWTGEEYLLQFSMEPKDVRLDRLNRGAPLLKDHMPFTENQIGVVESAKLDNGQGVATVRFSDNPSVDPIWNDVQSGIIRNVSMGVVYDELKDVTPKGQKKKHFMAMGWEPLEISLVPIGADPNANFLSGIMPYSKEMLAEIAQRLLSKPQDKDLSTTGAASAEDKQPFNRLQLAALLHRNACERLKYT